MGCNFCRRFGRGTWFLFVAILSSLLTAALILPILGGVASMTGIGKPLLFISFFLFAVALAILIFTVRRARKRNRKIAPALLRYWLILLGFSLSVNLISNLIEDINLNAAKRELKAAGIPLTLKEIIPLPVPPEENAAPTFQKAFILEKELAKKYEKEWESLSYYPHKLGAKTSSKFRLPRGLGKPYPKVIQAKDITAAQTAKLILDNPDFQNLYKLIDQAVSFPSCRFDLAYENGPEMPLPHLAALRQLARLNGVRIYLLAKRGRYHEALESARVGLLIGDCLKNEPILISDLSRVGIDIISMAALNDLLSRVPEICSAKNYQVLIQELDGKKVELGTTMGFETVFIGCFLFDRILKGYMPPFGNLETMDYHGKRFYGKIFFRYPAWITNPFSKKEFAFYLRMMKQIILEADKPYYQADTIYARLEKEILDSRYPMAEQILHYFVKGYADKSAGFHNPMMTNTDYLSRLNAFKIALAVRIYKTKTDRYPDKLSALAPDILPVLPLDPFTGKDFIYRKKGTGVIVYSIGQNLVDDNGRQDFKTKPPSDDIAWEIK